MKLITPMLIISFHDLSPECWKLCDRFITKLKSYGIDRISILLVPCWHGNSYFIDNPEFVEWLKMQVMNENDIILHGFYHIKSGIATGGLFHQILARFYTAGEGEFFQIEEAEAEQKLAKGLNLLEQIGIYVKGFVAPAWLMSKECISVLKKMGFRYTTKLNSIEFLQNNLKIYAPVLTFSSRSLGRRFLSLLWIYLWLFCNRYVPIIRLSVHSNDLLYSEIEKTIFSIIKKLTKTRIVLTYSDLL